MNKLRNKDIQFLLNTEIPSNSEVSFRRSDDGMDYEDTIIVKLLEED